jgi:hypothetical protein
VGRGKAKGSAFERNICKDISSAFKVEVQEVYRSINSGGHKDAFGDISMSAALAKKFPFSIECKFWKNVNLHDLFLPWAKMPKPKNRFRYWWTQCVRDAAKCGRTPLLVFKANNATVLVAVVMKDLTKEQVKEFRSMPHMISKAPANIKGDLRRIIIVPWPKFLKSEVQIQKGKKNAR